MCQNKRRRLRRQAFQQQNCKCFYCQLPIWEDGEEEFCQRFRISVRLAKLLKSTAEHLLAQQDGGKDTAENIVAACAWCNRRRHHGRHLKAPTPANYRCHIAKRVARGKWHPSLPYIVASLQGGVSNDPIAGNRYQ